MDRIYLQNVIEKVEHEKLVHDRKFVGNTAHAHCLPRFDQTLAKLREELRKLDNEAQE